MGQFDPFADTEKEAKMKKARYYIVTWTNWQGSKPKPVAGPYSSRREAEVDLEKYIVRSQDLRDQVFAAVVARSKIKMNDNQLAEHMYSLLREEQELKKLRSG